MVTTTNLVGFLKMASGNILCLQGEPTDAAAASELNVLDVAGTSQSLKDAGRGETITRIALQASDGSILTSLGIYKNGQYVIFHYGGERLADGPHAANLDIWDLSIPIDDTTKVMVVVND